MKTFRKLILLTLALVLAVPAATTLHAENDIPKIGIIQIIEHAALDAAREGFLEALKENGFEDGKNIMIDYRNAQGNPDILSSIADHFVGQEVDLVLAIATSAAQTMAGKTETIPILGTAITDYVDARLVESNEKPGYNVSGTTDMNPIKEQIALIKEMAPHTKSV
ncbi:MAG: sugar ABC transporter substrate-binding protein, partial [Clostridiales bacterium]|nr:sugar ABC transporter substrate-binding protein [Clostridiales bacterium]